jgi:pyridoxine 4-dehydrogenase
VLGYCASRGIAYLPYYPLLGGHVLRSAPVQTAVRALGVTPAQLAIAWLCEQSPVVVPIPGTRSRAHLRDNIAAQLFSLPPDVVASLEAEVRPGSAR